MSASDASDWPSGVTRGRGGRPSGPLEAVLAWARSHSMAVHPFVTGCCAVDLDVLHGPRHDLEALGVSWPPEPAPRQADLLLVAGPVSRRQASSLRRVYDQMAEPKWVMAVGGCACSGGVYDGYSILQGVDEVIPVDVFVPGCPPRAEAITDGLRTLMQRIGAERVGDAGRHGEPALR